MAQTNACGGKSDESTMTRRLVAALIGVNFHAFRLRRSFAIRSIGNEAKFRIGSPQGRVLGIFTQVVCQAAALPTHGRQQARSIEGASFNG